MSRTETFAVVSPIPFSFSAPQLPSLLVPFVPPPLQIALSERQDSPLDHLSAHRTWRRLIWLEDSELSSHMWACLAASVSNLYVILLHGASPWFGWHFGHATRRISRLGLWRKTQDILSRYYKPTRSFRKGIRTNPVKHSWIKPEGPGGVGRHDIQPSDASV
jgi:hypothetical protein